MIRPLRSAHRRTFFILLVVVPVVFVLGLVKREPRPAGSRAAVAGSGQVVSTTPVLTAISREGDAGWLDVRALRTQNDPDLLLYYSARHYPARHESANPAASGELPPDALLLGPAVAGSRFRLPGKQGTLVLYSLGHHKIVDQWPLEVKP